MPMSTREMFARMLKCEAGGEGIEGMKAVATVIMNRVHVSYGEYLRTGQGNLRKVMEQPWQFTCMMTQIGSQPNPQNIYTQNPEQIHYDVADWALSGNKSMSSGECLWYYNPFSPECANYFPRNKSGVYFNRVVEHCFYNPTSLYADT